MMGQEPSESVTPDTKATLLGSLSIPIWSFTPVFIVLLPVVSPFLLMGFRFLISGCILSLIGLSRGVSLRQQLTHHRGVWALSVTGILISQIIYVFSLQYAPTASANFINYLWPLYLIFLTGFYDQQKMQLRYWFSAILGFMGCAIIIGGGDHFQGFQLQHVIGYQLAAVAGLMWAFYSFFMRRHFVREQNSVQGGPFLLFAAICFAIYFAGSPSSVPVLSIEQWLYLFLFSVIPVAYGLWEHGIKHGNIRMLTILSYFIPMLSAIWIVWLTPAVGDENLWIGGALVVIAPLLAQIKIPNLTVKMASYVPRRLRS